jgi:hypothetical protein
MNDLRRKIDLWDMVRQIRGLKEQEKEKLRHLLNKAIKKDKDLESQKYYKHVLEELDKN